MNRPVCCRNGPLGAGLLGEEGYGFLVTAGTQVGVGQWALAVALYQRFRATTNQFRNKTVTSLSGRVPMSLVETQRSASISKPASSNACLTSSTESISERSPW
jgi:hypothetical protein